MLEFHKPMIVIFKHRLEVQTQVCNSETCVCRLIVHLACHTGATKALGNHTQLILIFSIVPVMVVALHCCFTSMVNI